MPHVVCPLEASCRRPFDVRGLLEFFAVRALPGVEVVDAERLLYRRTVDLARLSPGAPEGGPRPCVLRVDFGGLRMRAELHATAGEGLESLLEEQVQRRLRRLFDLDAHPDAIRSGLSTSPELASGGQSPASVRIPGAWCRFETAVRAVLGQQISVAGARTLAGRLVATAMRFPPAIWVCGRRSTATPGAPVPRRLAAKAVR